MYHRTQYRIELHSFDARANRARRYVLILTIDPTVETPYRVTSQWGRNGWFLRSDGFQCVDESTALSQMRSILKRRRAHGYRVTSVDEEHPLTDWLVDEGFPREAPPPSQPVLFPTPARSAVDAPMQGVLFRR